MPEHQGADLEALSDLCTPWCLRVVVTLRIAEKIAAGITDVAALAAAAGCDRDNLHRVLGRLAGKGVFEESKPGVFELNETARELLNPAVQIALDLEGIGGRMACVWGTLPSYVRTGASAFHEVYGRSFWEDLDANPDIAASFDALIGPTGHAAPDPTFTITAGWEAVHSLVDVGGGTGSMLAEILRAHPGIRGTLVDLPRAVARSAEVFGAAGVTDRVTAVGQSFFDPLPSGADLYLLRGVLNDWADPEALAILSRCAEAARPDGRVVVLKSVSAEGAASELGVEMVLAGGKRRNVAEFTALANRAGLEVVAAGQQPSYFVVECRPA